MGQEKTNIECNGFFVQDVDFAQLDMVSSGGNPNPTKDFIEENSYFLQGVDFIQLSLKGNGDNPNPTMSI